MEDALQYVKEQTEAICIEAVKQTGLALQYVKEQTEEICIEAVKKMDMHYNMSKSKLKKFA